MQQALLALVGNAGTAERTQQEMEAGRRRLKVCEKRGGRVFLCVGVVFLWRREGVSVFLQRANIVFALQQHRRFQN